MSPNAGQYEDSPMTRIFGGLLRHSWTQSWDSGLAPPLQASIEPFLVLHLDFASQSASSLSKALEAQLLTPDDTNFFRLPPYLLIHLQRFRLVDGVPTKIARHCKVDLRLGLEESANCALRTVPYELVSAISHYGELPESGSYKALVRHTRATPQGSGAAGLAGASDWWLFDDATVRAKSMEELESVLMCEGYHVCFLLYRREDIKTVNMRPHAF
eukprot:CAMPEP_0206613774 /NCGR_PEP_ID=MMETSP0325_2-20121206/56936_1 /ASSEMBLY_ACC=CAM_ASM_000347 /TAXON_ID=2866 /ORGANISM="Crypthecodinium cohnii, Strain Seligo" /LENGTH=214 /DNA_ID=CAMNT_0054134023 /DNA_START=4 /DNA_END=648 /DNA_ORIENTATION=+